MRFTQSRDEQRKATDEVLKWLEVCWQHRKDGREILPDPFYPRNEKLTPAVVEAVLKHIEGLMLKEFANYANYHRNAQGIGPNQHLVPPKFLGLPYAQQLAVVQGIDRIMQDYRAEEPAPAAPEMPPPDYWNYG